MLFLHACGKRFRKTENTGQVEVNRLLPNLVFGFEHRPERPLARVVHQNVDLARLADDSLRRLFDLVRISYIERNGMGVDPFRAELSGEFFQRFGPDVRQIQFHPVFAEFFGGSTSDAPGGAGDERGAVLEFHFCSSFPVNPADRRCPSGNYPLRF